MVVSDFTSQARMSRSTVFLRVWSTQPQTSRRSRRRRVGGRVLPLPDETDERDLYLDRTDHNRVWPSTAVFVVAWTVRLSWSSPASETAVDHPAVAQRLRGLRGWQVIVCYRPATGSPVRTTRLRRRCPGAHDHRGGRQPRTCPVVRAGETGRCCSTISRASTSFCRLSTAHAAS